MDQSQIETLRQVIQDSLGERPGDIQPLDGATSSELYRICLPGKDIVLRRFLPERWDSSPSDLSAREFAILSALADSGLPAPGAIGRLPGNGVLMTLLPGSVVLPRSCTPTWLDAMADMLCRIHASIVSVPFRYQSWNGQSDLPPPDWWQDARVWADAQQVVSSRIVEHPVLIHRDYHPVNLLWSGGRITGVVDWINACMGPRGVDVAHCRLNLALMYGQAAADGFLGAYRHRAPGYVHEACWDVDDALSFLPDAAPYPPWAVFGLKGLTNEIVRQRIQSFVHAALSTPAA